MVLEATVTGTNFDFVAAAVDDVRSSMRTILGIVC